MPAGRYAFTIAPVKQQDKRGNLALIIAGAVVVIAAILIWRARTPHITNADSHGTNVIAFGDSLTAGYGAGAGEDYPSRLAALVGTPIVNAGVSGDTTESALARIDDAVLARDPRIVIVGLGGNDLLSSTPIATTEANLREIVRRIERGGAAVVLLGFNFPSVGANYARMYERVAKDEGCLLVPDLLDGILSNPSLKSDEIHPNAKGYQLMAERVAGPLKKVMR
jgi:lysophospholipase L1-like esterase